MQQENKNSLNVLNVLLDNRIGGIHVRTLNVARLLRKKGVETIFCVPEMNVGTFSTLAKESKFKVFKIRNGYPSKKSLLLIFVAIRDIINIIKKENIDIVHSNGLLCVNSAFASFITRRKNIWHLIGNHYPLLFVNIVMPFVNLLSCRIVFISHILGKSYYSRRNVKYYDDSSVIYEPVDVNRFFPLQPRDKEKKKKNFLQKLNLNQNYKIIGFLGNINRVKNLKNLILSINYLKEVTSIEFILLIVGPKISTQLGYFEELERFIQKLNLEDKIFFYGPTDNPEEVLNFFDIFTLSSDREGTPLVILEAMAKELPIVSTNIAGIPEQVIEKVTGILVEPRNPEKLALALKKLLENDDLRREFGLAGRKHVLNEFPLKKCASSHYSLYRAVIND